MPVKPSFVTSEGEEKFYSELEKLPAYGRLISSSFGGLQPSAATVGPFGPICCLLAEKKLWRKNWQAEGGR